MIDTKECVACRHEIDAAARICPYCGADPESGRRFDPSPLLQSHFPMKDPAPRARIAEFVRERQGLITGAVIIAIFLMLGAAHQMITRRNQALESSAPAVPLTDLADLNNAGEEPEELPIPTFDFSWTGRPETMEVLLVEPGAVPPPDLGQVGADAPPAGAPSAEPAADAGPRRPAQPDRGAQTQPAPPRVPAQTGTRPPL